MLEIMQSPDQPEMLFAILAPHLLLLIAHRHVVAVAQPAPPTLVQGDDGCGAFACSGAWSGWIMQLVQQVCRVPPKLERAAKSISERRERLSEHVMCRRICWARRGAWFRCRVLDRRMRKMHAEVDRRSRTACKSGVVLEHSYSSTYHTKLHYKAIVHEKVILKATRKYVYS